MVSRIRSQREVLAGFVRRSSHKLGFGGQNAHFSSHKTGTVEFQFSSSLHTLYQKIIERPRRPPPRAAVRQRRRLLRAAASAERRRRRAGDRFFQPCRLPDHGRPRDVPRRADRDPCRCCRAGRHSGGRGRGCHSPEVVSIIHDVVVSIIIKNISFFYAGGIRKNYCFAVNH